MCSLIKENCGDAKVKAKDHQKCSRYVDQKDCGCTPTEVGPLYLVKGRLVIIVVDTKP